MAELLTIFADRAGEVLDTSPKIIILTFYSKPILEFIKFIFDLFKFNNTSMLYVVCCMLAYMRKYHILFIILYLL